MCYNIERILYLERISVLFRFYSEPFEEKWNMNSSTRDRYRTEMQGAI